METREKRPSRAKFGIQISFRPPTATIPKLNKLLEKENITMSEFLREAYLLKLAQYK